MIFHKNTEKKSNAFQYEPSLIEELIVAGLSQKEVGEKVGCSGSTIYQFCQRHNILSLKQRRLDADVIRNFVDEKKSQKFIASHIGTSLATLKRYMKHNHIKPSYCKPTRNPALNDSHLLEIQRMVSIGMLEREVAAIFTEKGIPCSQKDVSQLLVRSGSPPNNGRGRTRRSKKTA